VKRTLADRVFEPVADHVLGLLFALDAAVDRVRHPSRPRRWLRYR
jgi:hypothetical protein